MLVLTATPNYGTFSLRPVDKTTDRPVIREIFRREFFGDDRPAYPDDQLWQIYDGFDTSGIFGAYLVSMHQHPLFLLEVHPPIQIDLPSEYMPDPGSIGIYCFFHCRQDFINLPALRTCISSLFNTPSVCRILTTLGCADPADPKVQLLEKAGFQPLPQLGEGPAVFCCTRETFQPKNPGILFASSFSLTE